MNSSFLKILIQRQTPYPRKVAKGEKIRIETIRQHKNGNLIHVSVLGTPIEIEGGQVAVYGIYRDITDRKNAEIALRESEEKLRNILYSSPDAITVSDLRGYITECNQAALEIFDCTSEDELIGRNAIDLVIPSQKRQQHFTAERCFAERICQKR